MKPRTRKTTKRQPVPEPAVIMKPRPFCRHCTRVMADHTTNDLIWCYSEVAKLRAAEAAACAMLTGNSDSIKMSLAWESK